MKYMLLILDSEAVEAKLPAAELERIVEGHRRAWAEAQASNVVVDGFRLRPSAEAVTLRRRHGDLVVTDGPYAEAKEVLGGYWLIDCPSKDEAIEWARKLPIGDHGSVEVRPARTGGVWRGPTRGKRKYMVMFIADPSQPMSREKIFDSIDQHYDVSLELAAQGRFVSSRALEPPAAAATVRRRDGAYAVTDGPFAETKEFIAGYFVIACDSQAEAIEWADKLTTGPICEVRPVWETS